MSSVVVLTFDDPESAGKLRQTLRQLEKDDRLSLDDFAVVVKDAEGKVHVHGQMDRGVKYGAVGGSILGAMLFFMFPIAGIAAGAAGGAAVGAAFDLGIDKKFVKDVEDALKPSSSALFLNVRSADPNAALAALRDYKGHVYQTSLDPEREAELRMALKDETPAPRVGTL